MPSRALRQAREDSEAPERIEDEVLEDTDRLMALPVEVPMTPEAESALLGYLEEEIGDFLGTRTSFYKRLEELQDLYIAAKPTTEKNFPFKRASQITMPIAKMTVNVIAPRIIDELVRPDPLWSVRSSHRLTALERVANEAEDFMKLYAQRRMNVEGKIETMVLEGCKLGTHIFEVVMENLRAQTARYNNAGTQISVVSEEQSVGPQWRPIPLEDVAYKYGFADVQVMPWIGKQLHLTTHQIRNKVHSGIYRKEAADRVFKFPSVTGIYRTSMPLTAKHEEREKTQPGLRATDLFDVFELYVYWPIEVDTEEGKKTVTADLLVHYSYDARTLLSVRLNPWWHKKRPFLDWAYTPVEYRLMGEGISEQVEQFQEEITAMHRLRLDNQTLAGMRMIVITKMVEGIAPGDPIYPGKVIRAQNATDIQPFQLTDIYPSTVMNENLSMAFVERVTGINEATLGRAMPVTRTTATAQVSLLEEQAKRFNLTIRRARRVIGQAGEFVYDYFHQFGTNGLAEQWMGQRRGRLVELLFTVPRDQVVQGFSVGVVSTSPKVNKQLDMQANLQLFQLMQQLYQSMFQLVGALGPQYQQQVLPMIARSLVSSARRFMMRVLDSFDETDPEGVLQALTLLEMLMPDPAQMGPPQQLNEQTLMQAISVLRPELAGAVQEGLMQGAGQLGLTGGGNGGQIAASPVPAMAGLGQGPAF